MSAILNVSRRRFLKASALFGGGLIVAVHLPRFANAADDKSAIASKAKVFSPNAFVRIAPDGVVTVMCNHSEMGQGTMTSLALLVAEELDADWSKVRAEHAPTAPAYNSTMFPIQFVGGSNSTWTEWDRLRKCGAAAKAMLIMAAAQTWGVDASTCRAENGAVIHDASIRKLAYGALVDKASTLTPPQDVTLKDPKTFKLIGKPTKRLDTPEKVNGTGIFGIDVKMPNMLVAVVARPPVFGGKVKSFNADKAKAMPGVKDVVQIPRGVAVVADGYWPAHNARKALEIEWDEGPLASLDTAKQREQYAALAAKPGVVAHKEGDFDSALNSAAKKFEAVYELPYLAHAPMEPINCVADVRVDGCDVWTGTQFQTVDFGAAVQESGLSPEQVKLHTTLLGGGFGRRAVPDSHFVREAVQLSKAMKVPVKVIWSREDDTQGGYYRPQAYQSLRGGLDVNGNIVAWHQRIVCQSFIIGTPFESFIVKDGVDETAVEGGKDIPYAIPNVLVDWQQAPQGVPCLWWRSVGHSHNAFAVESFLDEMIHAAGKDPLEARRAMLKNHPRHLAALELAAQKAGWGIPLPKGRGRGIAVHESFGSFVAEVADVSVSKEGKLKVHKVVCAIDCGQTVNPDGIAAQMESGVTFGLTAAMYSQITFAKGRVQQENFWNYPMLRMHEAPVVEAHIVPSTGKMGGVGETGVPPLAPAVCNAIFAACGNRIRRLPISIDDLKQA